MALPGTLPSSPATPLPATRTAAAAPAGSLPGGPKSVFVGPIYHVPGRVPDRSAAKDLESVRREDRRDDQRPVCNAVTALTDG